MSPKQEMLRSHSCFLTTDIKKTAEFYRDVLGFSFEQYWGEPPCFVMLRRDDVEFFFTEVSDAKRVRPNSDSPVGEIWDCYVRVEDVDALCAEFKKAGVKIIRGPETAFYEMKEFEIRDPNSYILCFAEDVEGKPETKRLPLRTE
ncbi:MAG: VOC family protein [Acidobacteria bacterium]|nr:VOC family protein [Acidobacteriota bacterium]